MSTTDLEGGAQPIANEDDSIFISVDGGFYDHERIRQALIDRGHRFRTDSDSEILLHLYEEQGPECVEALRGEFAFVLWDEQAQCLLAARDRFGIRPLYYAIVGDLLVLGSEIKALFAAGVRARWDNESVYQRLVGGVYLGPLAHRSLFEGVRQIPPGHYLTASRKGVRLCRYWDFNYPREGDERRIDDEQACIEEVRNALIESIRLRLRADVTVGCYLSGGIDSCAVLGLASAMSSRPPTAFTISFDDDRFDEVAAAREMARYVGADVHVLRVTRDMLADYFVDAVVQNETTIAGNVVAKYMLSEMIRDVGYKVVLTGEGSDAIFAGGAGFAWDKLRPDTSGNAHAPDLAVVRQRLGFVPNWLRRNPQSHRVISQLIDTSFTQAFARHNCYLAMLDALDVDGQVAGRSPLNKSLYLYGKQALPNLSLSGLGDRAEMGHSIEGRLPFLDHRLVEIVQELPAELKISPVTDKYILREAARPFVPRSVFERGKHPFLAPPNFDGRMGDLILDIVSRPAANGLPFIEGDRITAALGAGGAAVRRVAVTVACLCVLQERYRVN